MNTIQQDQIDIKERVSWDNYFMSIAQLVASRSTCLRQQVGCVIVRDNHILATGYNGAPKGASHCLDIGCYRHDNNIPSGTLHETCRGTHAEQNAIAMSAKMGISIDKATLYCTHKPCYICTKIIINAGITKIVYLKDYPDNRTNNLIDEIGFNIKQT